jgi:Zn-dependent protease with chaperone function
MRLKITNTEFKEAIHPKENSRFTLVLIFCIPVAVIGLLLVIASLGFILIYVFLLLFIVWFSSSVLKAHLIGNSIKVSSTNFPEIHNTYIEVKTILSYTKDIPIYIVPGGTVNAFLHKFYKTNFIVLNSKLVEGMSTNSDINQMRWIIGRFIGALRAKHQRLDFLRIIIESIERIRFFNVFIFSYERKTQYTGDNIGLLVCESVEDAFIAFDKCIIGNTLAQRVQFEGIVEQGKELDDSFFSLIARVFSRHPHLVDRYINLLAYAQKAYPEQFKEFIVKSGHQTTLNIGSLLPKY